MPTLGIITQICQVVLESLAPAYGRPGPTITDAADRDGLRLACEVASILVRLFEPARYEAVGSNIPAPQLLHPMMSPQCDGWIFVKPESVMLEPAVGIRFAVRSLATIEPSPSVQAALLGVMRVV